MPPRGAEHPATFNKSMPPNYNAGELALGYIGAQGARVFPGGHGAPVVGLPGVTCEGCIWYSLAALGGGVSGY